MPNQNEIKLLLEAYEKRLLGYVHRFVPLETAREIVQETFLRCWQKGEAASVSAPWLFHVARNLALDHLKRGDTRMSRQSSSEIEIKDDQEGADTRIERREQQSKLWSLVEKLPPHQREVLTLKFQEDFSYKQISDITGHSVSYVGVLIHEGMSQLRGGLK